MLTRDGMLKKVIEIQASKYKLRNSKTLTDKLVALRHEKIIKLFLKRSVLKRGMLKSRARFNRLI